MLVYLQLPKHFRLYTKTEEALELGPFQLKGSQYDPVRS